MADTYVPAALRQLVRKRAGEKCEYCLTSESASFTTHEIDHIIAEKHGGLTEEDNLALSCALCNKHKGSDLTSIDPETNQIVPLHHPRQDHWSDHFQIVEAAIMALTPTCRVTVRLLQLNRAERITERRLLIEAGLFNVPV